jgi:hypothetical protein
VAVPIGGVVLLLVVVAMASHGIRTASAGSPSGARSVPGIPGAAAHFVFVMFLGGALGAMLLFVIALLGILRPHRKNPEEFFWERPHAPWWSGVIALLLIAAVFAALIALLIWSSGALGRQPQSRAGVRPFGRVAAPGESGPARSEVASLDEDRTVAAIAAGVAIAAVVLIVGSRRRREPPAAVDDDVRRQEVGRAVEETIEDIRRDPDPRHAVITAYARMERTLTASGWPRRPSRTPLEYLEETLRRLRVPAPPARALTELFEIARFSRQRVDDSMKQRAIEALVAVRQALAVEAS